MASVWEHLGELANVGQLANINAVSLIAMIIKAATTAKMHKKNCRQFAQHLKLIGNLLEQLNISELKKYPETAKPLEQLEDALRRSYILVQSCQDRSYLYLLAMGWNIVYQFRRAQNEIDRYLKIVPLISLVDNQRVRDRLEYIDKDQHEYTFDEEDRKVQGALLNPDDYNAQVKVLKKTLSCTYPNMPFEQALQKENEKLQIELQRSQSSMDLGQCEVIQRLLGVTESMASSLPENTVQLKNFEKVEPDYVGCDMNYSHQQDDSHKATRSPSTASSGRELISNKGSGHHEEWNSDLLGCCSEPSLCLRTFFCPCGTFSRISTVANRRYISSTEACNDLLAFSLILSCCCYTCCIRRKLRKMLSIRGGFCDDFLSHFMCCCCALVQEWREVEYRGVYGTDEKMTTAPPSQYMES